MLRFADSTSAQKEHLEELQKPIDDQKDHAVKQLEGQKAPKRQIMEKEMKTHAKRHEAAEPLKKEELEYEIEKIRRRGGDDYDRAGVDAQVREKEEEIEELEAKIAQLTAERDGIAPPAPCKVNDELQEELKKLKEALQRLKNQLAKGGGVVDEEKEKERQVRALLDKLMLAPKTDADEKQNANVRLDLEEEVDRWAKECDYAILKGRFEHLKSEIETKERGMTEKERKAKIKEMEKELKAKIKEMEEALEKDKKKAEEEEEAKMQTELQAARDKAAGAKEEFDDDQQQALEEFMANQKAALEEFEKQQKDAKEKKEKELMDDKAKRVKKRQKDLQEEHDKDVKKIKDGNHEPVFEKGAEHKIHELTEDKEKMAKALDATVMTQGELEDKIEARGNEFKVKMDDEEEKFEKAEKEIAGKSKRSFC